MITKLRVTCLCILSLIVLTGKTAHAVVLPDFPFDIPSQTIRDFVPAGLNHEFLMPVGYDIGFSQQSGYNITQNIQLTGVDPGSLVKDFWKTSTEGIWSTRDRFTQPIIVSVQFVEQGAHHAVTVSPGLPPSVTNPDAFRGNQLHWFAGWSGPVGNRVTGTGSPAPWAHEVGHMFGNFDEYPGGGVNPNGSFGNEPGFMGQGFNGPPGTELTLFDRQYQFVADWAAAQAGAAAAEPATFLLMATGLGGILLNKKITSEARTPHRCHTAASFPRAIRSVG